MVNYKAKIRREQRRAERKVRREMRKAMSDTRSDYRQLLIRQGVDAKTRRKLLEEFDKGSDEVKRKMLREMRRNRF